MHGKANRQGKAKQGKSRHIDKARDGKAPRQGKAYGQGKVRQGNSRYLPLEAKHLVKETQGTYSRQGT
jgi:hypothetical protein